MNSKILKNMYELNCAAEALHRSVTASCKKMHDEMPDNPRAQLLDRIEVILVVIDPTTSDAVLMFDTDSKNALLHSAASAIRSTLSRAAQYTATTEEVTGEKSN